MEMKGGCCIAPRHGSCAGGGGSDGAQASTAWQMGKILLKFRPIAPKPAALAPVPTPKPALAPAAGPGRGKRKAVGGGGGRRGRKPTKGATAAPSIAAAQMVVDRKESEKEKSLSSRSSSSSGMTSVDSAPRTPAPATGTLPLMPLSPLEGKVAAATAKQPALSLAPAVTAHAVPAQLVPPRPTPPCWVTVEEVTATWQDGETPSAATAYTSGDEAPAFVSDQWGRVTWTNAAFSRAASAETDGDASEARVGLAGTLPAWGSCAGFTCRVRVRYATARSLVAPCDVWRLDDSGCYLWRLDLQAALTLTLGGLQ